LGGKNTGSPWVGIGNLGTRGDKLEKKYCVAVVLGEAGVAKFWESENLIYWIVSLLSTNFHGYDV
jgi:hypothetical protein